MLACNSNEPDITPIAATDACRGFCQFESQYTGEPCAIVNTTITPSGCDPIVTVIFTAKDSCGNQNNLTLLYVPPPGPTFVQPQSVLTITCSEISILGGSLPPPVNPGCVMPVVSTIVGQVGEYNCVDGIPTALLTVQFTLSDGCHTDVADQQYAVINDISQFSLDVSPITVQPCLTSFPVLPPTTPVLTGACSPFSVGEFSDTVPMFSAAVCGMVISRTYTVQDTTCNNALSFTVTQNFTFVDETPPTLALRTPGIIPFACGASIPVPTSADATSTDACTSIPSCVFVGQCSNLPPPGNDSCYYC
jgi:hypothetical protein